MNTVSRSNFLSRLLILALFLGAVISAELSLGSLKIKAAAYGAPTAVKVNQTSIQSTDESRVEVGTNHNAKNNTATGTVQSSIIQSESSSPEGTNKVEVNVASSSTGNSTGSSQTVVNNSSSSSTFSQSQTSIQSSGGHVRVSQ